MTRVLHELPIACEIGVFSPAERARHGELLGLIAASRLSVEARDDGFAFRYPAEAELIARIAEWITLERRCCRFLTFSLHLPPGEGPLTVRITGGPGVKEFIAAQLGMR